MKKNRVMNIWWKLEVKICHKIFGPPYNGSPWNKHFKILGPPELIFQENVEIFGLPVPTHPLYPAVHLQNSHYNTISLSRQRRNFPFKRGTNISRHF